MGPDATDARQMIFDFSRSIPVGDAPEKERLEDHARRIAGFLSTASPCAVDVVLNDNRHTMISFKHFQGRLVVRLHRMFRHAGTRELAALTLFVKGRDPGASRELDRFIEIHRDEIDARPRRRSARRIAEGSAHDLGPVLERVRRHYFDGLGEVAICWSAGRDRSSRRRKRSRSRSRALATYSYEDRTIRVNPVLDSARVPEFVLEWIVYHEMLHHVLPLESADGRRRFHTRRFRALEHAFERYEEARDWEKANLDWLLG
jgi:predicted metal-dependent hydrolase